MSQPSEATARTRRTLLLVGCLLASLLQSIFFSYALVTDIDEGAYMMLGRLAVMGEISLFQNEMTGQRMPLPYYVIGLSQILWGPSLVAARLTSATLGLACLALVYAITRRLGGEAAGVLALLFAVTEGTVVAYFASAYSHALVSLELLAAVYFEFATTLRQRSVMAMGCVALLFFTRPQFAPLIPLACVYLLWKSDRRSEQAVIVALTILPPIAFLIWDPNHLKLVAYVPMLRTIVRPLGFVAASPPRETALGSNLVEAAVLIGRWYRPWLTAVMILVVLRALGMLRGAPNRGACQHRGIGMIAIVIAYLVCWQLLIFGAPRNAVGYLPSFAILVAMALGLAFARLIDERATARGVRLPVAAFLVMLFLASPAMSRPPTLPRAVSWSNTTPRVLEQEAEVLRRLIPHDSRVFLFGPSQPLYYAGLSPYLRQITHLYTLTTEADPELRRRSGLWGAEEIRQWLTTDADYAVISSEAMKGFWREQQTPSGNDVELMRDLLRQHFDLVATIGPTPRQANPQIVYDIYKRKATSAGRDTTVRTSAGTRPQLFACCMSENVQSLNNSWWGTSSTPDANSKS